MKGVEIRAVAMIRRIRDKQARFLAGKSGEQVIAFFREAGERARHDAARANRERARPGERSGSAGRSRRSRTQLARRGRRPSR